MKRVLASGLRESRMEMWDLAGEEGVKDRQKEQGTEEKQRREVASSAPDYTLGQLFGGWGVGLGEDWEVCSS